MTIHKRCDCGCGRIGHKREMIKHKCEGRRGGYYTYYYFRECYKKEFKVKKCLCGKGWVKA